MRARHILLAATLLAGTAGAAVLAQEIATYDPRQLPAIQGKVAHASARCEQLAPLDRPAARTANDRFR
jgi:hypothetical protein